MRNPRRCNRCKETKPYEEYPKDRTHNGVAHRDFICLKCKRDRAWSLKNPPKEGDK